MEHLLNKITCGDCLEVIRGIPDNSVDSVVTDPPYFLINESGKGFMGKEWESLNNSKIIDIVCKQKNNVFFVEQFLLLLKVEQNTIVENIAQETVNITLQNLEIQKKNTSAAFVANALEDMTVPFKVDTASVQGIVLTKEDVLVMLKESYPNHTPSKIEKCNDTALFVIPLSFIKTQVKNTVLENVLKLSIESTCSDSEIPLLLTEEVRIKDVIVARIGIWLKNKYMNETDIVVNSAGNIVGIVKYRRIISNPTNFQRIMNYLTLLLYTSDVMPKSRMELFQSVIKTFYINCFSECCRVLKDGAFAFICFTPRQDSLTSMMDALKQSGFNVGFTPIYWVYSSGFPKAANVAKLVDKRLGVECETFTRADGSAGGSIVTDLNPQNNLLKREYEEKLPTSPEAKALDGSYAGFQPKPALEVIIQAQKPISIYSYLTIITSQTIKLIDEVSLCANVVFVESNLRQHQIVRDIIAQKNAMGLIGEELKAHIGMVGNHYELMDMLKFTIDELITKQDTNLNIVQLWKLILADLLINSSKFTTKMVIEQTIELKTLNSLLSQSIRDNTITQNEMNVSGLALNVTIVESIIENALIRLQLLKQITAQKNAGSQNLINAEHTDVPNVELNLKPTIQNENIARNNVITQLETKVIIVAMKPLSEKSYIDQALKNGKGVTWLGDGRIPFVSDDDKAAAAAAAREHQQHRANLDLHNTVSLIIDDSRVGKSPEAEFDKYMASQGRFPANLLVSDDVLNNGVSGQSIGHSPNIKTTGFGSFGGGTSDRVEYKSDTYINDSGSFSRFFDLDRWFSERVKKLPKEVRDTFPFLIVPKPAKSEKDEGCDNINGNQAVLGISKICKKCAVSQPLAYGANVSDCVHEWIDPPLKNSHPTVKPVDLMSYLITIGSRPNDIILEPFCGSGTTMVSAWLMNRNCIGIELNPDYVKIAEARFKEYNAQQKLKIWAKKEVI